MKKIVVVLMLCFLGQMSYGQVFLRYIERDTTPQSVMVSDTAGVANWSEGGILDTMYQKTDSVCFRFVGDATDMCYELLDSDNQSLSILRDGDTLRLTISGGNTVAWSDSTRSDADIGQIVADSMVNIYNSDGVINEDRAVQINDWDFGVYGNSGASYLVDMPKTSSNFYTIYAGAGEGIYFEQTDNSNYPTLKKAGFRVKDFEVILNSGEALTGLDSTDNQ